MMQPGFMRQLHQCCRFLLLIALGCVPFSRAQTSSDSSEFERWESAIQAFEKSDAAQPPPKNAILFLGSSSIRKWDTLNEDFPGRPLIQRGFGGSQIVDSTHFAHRIVLPYRPRQIVLYAGDNDIAAKKSAEQVLADFKAFVRTVHRQLPKTRISFISIKPSLSRWSLVSEIRKANRLVGDYCRTDERLDNIDIFTPMLGPDGKPRADLLSSDGLHCSRKGYSLWASVIRPYLK